MNIKESNICYNTKIYLLNWLKKKKKTTTTTLSVPYFNNIKVQEILVHLALCLNYM